MKSVLVPIEDHDGADAALHQAAVFADRYGSEVDCVPLRPPQFQAVGAEPIVAVSFPPADDDTAERMARARQRFDAFNRSHRGGDAKPLRWRAGPAIEDAELGALARVFDITILGRPTATGHGARMTTLEAALFESGRPILITPPEAGAEIGRNVVVSWNQSTEAASTLVAAMPVLARADTVSILKIDTAIVPGPGPEEVQDYLALHNIRAHVVVKEAHGANPGAAIPDHATQLGADLLVKSAYTQSRLRQMIFGGATSHILSHTHLPVFMAN